MAMHTYFVYVHCTECAMCVSVEIFFSFDLFLILFCFYYPNNSSKNMRLHQVTSVAGIIIITIINANANENCD